MQTHAARGNTVKHQRAVGLGKVVVRADLNRTIGAVLHHQRRSAPTRVEVVVSDCCNEFARDHDSLPFKDLFSDNRLVHGDQLGAVGKCGFDLDVRNHFGDAVHHVGTSQYVAAFAH